MTKLPWWLKPANKVVIALNRAGLALGSQHILSVPGRKTGRLYPTPVSILTVDGDRYVCTAYATEWVKNARIAGWGLLARGRNEDRVGLVELPVAERGAIPRTRAVLSGYLGDPGLGAAVLRTVARVREARPDMLYACDPVMGDEGRGFFVRPGIPEFFRDHAVPVADIVTPNQFELAWLADRPIASLEDALAAAAAVRATGPRVPVFARPSWPHGRTDFRPAARFFPTPPPVTSSARAHRSVSWRSTSSTRIRTTPMRSIACARCETHFRPSRLETPRQRRAAALPSTTSW